MTSNENDTRQGAGTSNIIPFQHPGAPIGTHRQVPKLRPKPVLRLGPAKLTRPPPKVEYALEAVIRPGSVAYEKRSTTFSPMFPARSVPQVNLPVTSGATS